MSNRNEDRQLVPRRLQKSMRKAGLLIDGAWADDRQEDIVYKISLRKRSLRHEGYPFTVHVEDSDGLSEIMMKLFHAIRGNMAEWKEYEEQQLLEKKLSEAKKELLRAEIGRAVASAKDVVFVYAMTCKVSEWTEEKIHRL
jgi:hypothetical protein